MYRAALFGGFLHGTPATSIQTAHQQNHTVRDARRSLEAVGTIRTEQYIKY